MPSAPEIHPSPHPTPHIPSSPLPFLIYRSALPTPPSSDTTSAFIESNGWYHGGTFKNFPRSHFHSVTHECYAVVSGGSLLRVGARGRGVAEGEEEDEGKEVRGRCVGIAGRKGGGEEEGEGIEVEVGVGDVIVLPAGVSHYSISSYGGYEYLGLYPQVLLTTPLSTPTKQVIPSFTPGYLMGSPHWDNNFCDADEQKTAEKAATCRKVPLPETDPIFGAGGPLVGIWKRATEEANPTVWK